MQVLDQLVNAPDARREVATVLCHERREIVVDIGAGGVLLEELVQIPHHVPDPGQVLGGDALDALLQALEVRPEHLLPQLVSQVGEGGSCRVVHELVVAQSVETPRQVRWQRVEPVLTLACSSTHDLLRQAGLLLRLAGGRVECTALRVAHPLPDSLTLGLEDLLEATVHVVQHAVQVGSLELGLASGTQLLHDSSQSRHVAAPGATQATLHEPLECAAHIALGQDVVGERIEHIVRVECWQLLAAIPSGVADGAHGPCSLGRSRHAVHPQPATRSDRGEIAQQQLPIVILGDRRGGLARPRQGVGRTSRVTAHLSGARHRLPRERDIEVGDPGSSHRVRQRRACHSAGSARSSTAYTREHCHSPRARLTRSPTSPQ